MFKKYKHSRLALLIIVALALAVGYACGMRHRTATAEDRSRVSSIAVQKPPQTLEPPQNPDKRIPIGPTDI